MCCIIPGGGDGLVFYYFGIQGNQEEVFMKGSRRLWVIFAVIMVLFSVQLACSVSDLRESNDQVSTYEAEETQTRAAARTETKAARQTEKAEEDIEEET